MGVTNEIHHRRIARPIGWLRTGLRRGAAESRRPMGGCRELLPHTNETSLLIQPAKSLLALLLEGESDLSTPSRRFAGVTQIQTNILPPLVEAVH